MAKRPRFLPEYVTKFRDRHGKLRYRYRRKGHAGGYFKGELGSDDFRQEYAAFEAALVDETTIGAGRHPVNSVADVIARYVSQPARLGPTPTTQQKVRAILGRFQERYGTGKAGPRYITDFTFEHIDKILGTEREKRPEGKRMVGGIEAARKLRKELVRLFDYAEKIGVRPMGSNPVRKAETIRVAAGERSTGFHSWTEEEIAQYRDTHQLGTTGRLALELLLWTGQRRGDGYLFGPGDVRDGRFEFRQGKSGKAMLLPLAPQLVAALTAMPPPPAGATAYLLTERGKPYGYAGFGNKMREWCDKAGLPHCTAHGLRKANARRMAELGMNNQTLKAVGGWTNDREVAIYTAAANQSALADAAIGALAAWETARVSNRECLTDAE
jgi:integrase